MQTLAGRTFEISASRDIDPGATQIAGSAYDADVGAFGKNYPALWTAEPGGGYELRTFNGLTASTTWTVGTFTALTPDNDFAVGFGGSTSVQPGPGRQAFLYAAAGNTFTGLPFIPSASNNRSEAHAVSDEAEIIVGVAGNASNNDVAAAWYESGGSYVVQELPRFGGAAVSEGLAVSGDGHSLGGSVGTEAAVWNGDTFEVIRLEDSVARVGLTIPPECMLSSVTDLDYEGKRVVGDAICGAEGVLRTYEFELPFPVPEPGVGVSIAFAIPFLAMLRGRRLSVE